MFSSDVMVDVIGGGWVGRDTFVILKIGKVFFVVGKLSVALIPSLKISVCITFQLTWMGNLIVPIGPITTRWLCADNQM